VKCSVEMDKELFCFGDSICRNREDCIFAVIILVVIGIIIIAASIGASRILERTDNRLTQTVHENLINTERARNLWGLSHFVLFAILGFFFPSCDIVIISIGILWEFVEHILGIYARPISPRGRAPVQWWYGSAMDVVINILGFYVGKSIRLLSS